MLEEKTAPIISLGGGTWTVPENREIIKQHGLTSIWLESSFEHCWYNIRASKKDRPLARNKRPHECSLKNGRSNTAWPIGTLLSNRNLPPSTLPGRSPRKYFYKKALKNPFG